MPQGTFFDGKKISVQDESKTENLKIRDFRVIVTNVNLSLTVHVIIFIIGKQSLF